MSFETILYSEQWKQANGDKKEYGKLLWKRNKKAIDKQKQERLSNLKRMLAKGSITQEEYDIKITQ